MTDRDAILDVVARYGLAVDRRDNVLYRGCFWPDATFTSGEVVMRGEEFLDPAQRRLFAPPRVFVGLDRVDASTHTMGGTAVAGATATTSCLVHLIGERDGRSGIVVVRGVEYHDRFERRDGVWRIAFRAHAGRWAYEVPQ